MYFYSTVGLNGSGKSNLLYGKNNLYLTSFETHGNEHLLNIFAAIQFVMANEFDHIPNEQLASMLHTAGKPASVEVIFNNDDQRWPNVSFGNS